MLYEVNELAKDCRDVSTSQFFDKQYIASLGSVSGLFIPFKKETGFLRLPRLGRIDAHALDELLIR